MMHIKKVLKNAVLCLGSTKEKYVMVRICSIEQIVEMSDVNQKCIQVWYYMHDELLHDLMMNVFVLEELKLFESYEFIHMLQTQSSYTNNINLEYRLITYSNLITRPI